MENWKKLSRKLSILFIITLIGCTPYKVITSSTIAIPEINKPIYDTEKVINDISVGMTKKQVIEILGYPLSTEAENNKECLSYPLTTANKETFSLLFTDGILTKYNKSQKCIQLFEK